VQRTIPAGYSLQRLTFYIYIDTSPDQETKIIGLESAGFLNLSLTSDRYLKATEKRDSPKVFWLSLVIYCIICGSTFFYFWMKGSKWYYLWLFLLIAIPIVGIVGRQIRDYYRRKKKA